VIELETAMRLLTSLQCLRGYPQNEGALHGLAKGMSKICPDEEHAQWLVDAVLDGCAYCPTPIEMRRIYCQKFPPADGREDHQVDQSDRMASRGRY
jgi:hypothetical protein